MSADKGLNSWECGVTPSVGETKGNEFSADASNLQVGIDMAEKIDAAFNLPASALKITSGESNLANARMSEMEFKRSI